MTEQEMVNVFKEQMERNKRWQERHIKTSQYKGYQDALIDLVYQMNNYRASSYRKTIDVDVVYKMLFDHIDENKNDIDTLMDEIEGKGKILHLDENIKWRNCK